MASMTSVASVAAGLAPAARVGRGSAASAGTSRHGGVTRASVVLPQRTSAFRGAAVCGQKVQAGAQLRARRGARGLKAPMAMADEAAEPPPKGTRATPMRDPQRPLSVWEIMFGKFGRTNEGKTRPIAFWRVMSCLPYLIPLMGTIAFTGSAYTAYPFSLKVMWTFAPCLQIFYGHALIPFCTFFALFLFVVRNTNLPHFVRYNTMQAILLDICVMLAGLIIQYLPVYLMISVVGSLLEVATFCNGVFAIFYSVCMALQGLYPEMPLITEAVYAQVREIN